MPLYVVRKRNPYYKVGTFLQLFDDGFQEAVMEKADGNRLRVHMNRGIVMPEEVMAPFVMQVLRRGLDHNMRRSLLGRKPDGPSIADLFEEAEEQDAKGV